MFTFKNKENMNSGNGFPGDKVSIESRANDERKVIDC